MLIFCEGRFNIPPEKYHGKQKMHAVTEMTGFYFWQVFNRLGVQGVPAEVHDSQTARNVFSFHSTPWRIGMCSFCYCGASVAQALL